ncbi:pyruvate kinase [Paragonimus westermani]|uniref:Pyruvate kinase n=1 Tax=Paragonimus westermani TaxID=34504 RepID=A0A5J4N922_9TREM|nr:pyruvate kinase [Paragonimus westermani]
MDLLLESSPLKIKPNFSSNTEDWRAYYHQLQQQQYIRHARTQLEHVSQLDIDHDAVFVRHTATVCTLGDLWNTDEKITTMIKDGMNILRLNLSMASYDYYADVIRRVRAIERALNYQPVVAIALDISAPPVRTGLIQNNVEAVVTLNDGQIVKLTVDTDLKNSTSDTLIFIDTQYFPTFIHCVKPGDRIHLDDGMLTLIVRELGLDNITCLVEQGGELQPMFNEVHKAISAVGNVLICQTAESITRHLKQLTCGIWRLLWNPKYCSHRFQPINERYSLNELMEVADGIIVGRQGLGLVYPTEKIFQLQKQIIGKCNIVHKPVFVISQLLESMRFKPRPTRAEVSDVANAVLDGADGLVLTVETSRGLFPKEALHVLHMIMYDVGSCVISLFHASCSSFARPHFTLFSFFARDRPTQKICREAESAIFHKRFVADLQAARDARGLSPLDPAYLSALAAVEAANSSNTSAIFVVTTTGRSASAIAAFRPSCPVVPIMRRPEVARLCHSFRGLHPFVHTSEKLEDWSRDMDARLNAAMKYALSRGFVALGDQVVVVTGWKAGTGATNTVRVLELPRDGRPISIVNSQSQLTGDAWFD